jgi:hypothetical protein
MLAYVGVVGLPPHAISAPIAVAIKSLFIFCMTPQTYRRAFI